MSLVRVNAEGGAPVCADGTDLDGRLRAGLDAVGRGAPILLMIHGYKYSPGDPSRCPHRSILAPASADHRPRRCRSWPEAIGFDASRGDVLCIAFGWDAAGTIWRAARSADAAARALAALLHRLSGLADRPVQILAHSLGARVALGALPSLPRGAVGRMVLLHGAEFRSRARAAIATPAGRAAEVINVTTRENDLFDLLFRTFLAPHRPLDPALSAGLGRHRPNWLDLRIDDPASRAALSAMGFAIPAPERRICHWSAYMRPGMFDLHRVLLLDPRRLPLAGLATVLPDGARRGALETLMGRPRPETALPAPVRVPS